MLPTFEYIFDDRIKLNEEHCYKKKNHRVQILKNLIGCVMVSVLPSSVVDRRFKPRTGKIKDYEIGICCFSTTHAALRRKNKDLLARSNSNVSEWNDMPINCCFCELVLYKSSPACWSSRKQTPSLSSHQI